MSGTARQQPEDPAPHQVREPPDPPMVPFAVAGMVIWAIATLVVLPFRDSHPSWLWICVAGFLWGIPGLIAMIRHDRRRAGAASSGLRSAVSERIGAASSGPERSGGKTAPPSADAGANGGTATREDDA